MTFLARSQRLPAFSSTFRQVSLRLQSTAAAAAASSPEGEQPTPAASTSASSSAKPQSSVPGGTPLKGLSYLKGAPEVEAMPDDAYPDWLWKLTDTKQASGPPETLAPAQAARQVRRQAIRTANFTSAKS